MMDISALITDINDSWALALASAGISQRQIAEIRMTVEDAIDNNIDADPE